MRRLLIILLFALVTSSACATTQILPVPFSVKPDGSDGDPFVCANPYTGFAIACAQVVEDDLPVSRRPG